MSTEAYFIVVSEPDEDMYESLLEQLEDETDEYYIGENETKMFLGVPKENVSILVRIFPEHTPILFDKKTLPLHYDFEEDGI